MIRRCEVCLGLMDGGSEGSEAKPKLRRLLVGDRIVALCEPHFASASAAEPDSVDALRALFGEDAGRRSLLLRRSPLDRRIFPPRPEGRRRGAGRRATDAD